MKWIVLSDSLGRKLLSVSRSIEHRLILLPSAFDAVDIRWVGVSCWIFGRFVSRTSRWSNILSSVCTASNVERLDESGTGLRGRGADTDEEGPGVCTWDVEGRLGLLSSSSEEISMISMGGGEMALMRFLFLPLEVATAWNGHDMRTMR